MTILTIFIGLLMNNNGNMFKKNYLKSVSLNFKLINL